MIPRSQVSLLALSSSRPLLSSALRTRAPQWHRALCLRATSSPFSARHSSNSSYSSRNLLAPPQRRHASSSTNRPSPQPTPPTSEKIPHAYPAINPPPTTRPPPLENAPRREREGTVAYAYRSGKAYLAFYKAGVKHVWTNYKLVRALRRRLRRLEREDAAATASPSSSSTPANPLSHAAPSGGWQPGVISTSSNDKNKNNNNKKRSQTPGSTPLTRAERQLLHRHAADLPKIPVFLVLIAVAGEWLPLLVPFVSGAVPRPCWIPSQARRVRETRERRRARRIGAVLQSGSNARGAQRVDARLAAALARVQRGEVGVAEAMAGLGADEVRLAAAMWDLYGGLWDRWVPLRPPWLAWKVRRWWTYLVEDDRLLIRDGTVAQLEPDEVRIACEERGMDVLDQDVARLRRQLQEWLAEYPSSSSKGKSG